MKRTVLNAAFAAEIRAAVATALTAALLAAQPVLAAGLGIPDLGATALGEAGATVARPEDGTAIYYNPAALAAQDGVRLLLDGRAIDDRVTFQRLDANGNNTGDWPQVENLGGLSVAPIAVASVRWRRFTFALGGHPFSGATGYHYADPATVKSPQDAPQRYLSIDQTSKIYIPALAAAFAITPRLSIGAALQLPIASFTQRQSIYAGPISGEIPQFDATLDIHASQVFARSGVLGISALPLDWLALGASLQLQTNFRADGTVQAQLPPIASQLGLSLTGDRIRLDLVLPWVARAGARIYGKRWSLELAGTFEHYSQLREIRITPIDISLQLSGRTVVLAPFILHRDLTNAGSLRLGGDYCITSHLKLRAGILGETSAIPEQRQSLDWLAWERLSLNLGLTARLGQFDLTVSAARFIQPTRQVRDSQETQLAPLPGVTPVVVGNGDYSSQLTLFAASISTKL